MKLNDIYIVQVSERGNLYRQGKIVCSSSMGLEMFQGFIRAAYCVIDIDKMGRS